MNVDNQNSKYYKRNEYKKKDINSNPELISCKSQDSHKKNTKKSYSTLDKIKIASIIGMIPSTFIFLISMVPTTITFIKGTQNKFANLTNKVTKYSRNTAISCTAVAILLELYQNLKSRKNNKSKE